MNHYSKRPTQLDSHLAHRQPAVCSEDEGRARKSKTQEQKQKGKEEISPSFTESRRRENVLDGWKKQRRETVRCLLFLVIDIFVFVFHRLQVVLRETPEPHENSSVRNPPASSIKQIKTT